MKERISTVPTMFCCIHFAMLLNEKDPNLAQAFAVLVFCCTHTPLTLQTPMEHTVFGT